MRKLIVPFFVCILCIACGSPSHEGGVEVLDAEENMPLETLEDTPEVVLLDDERFCVADHVCINGLYYDLYSDYTAEVTTVKSELYNEEENYYTTLYGAISIPAYVNFGYETYSVTRIGSETFYNCDKITSVAIPNTVTDIGSSAFLGCYGLKYPIYNAHVFAFLPSDYEGEYTIPYGIETIANGAFRYCSKLTSLTIPNSVTNIGDWSIFYGCERLSSPIYNAHVFAYLPPNYEGEYIIPDGIETIAREAFKNCKGLTYISIPNSVKNIGYDTFKDCENIDKPLYNAHVFMYLPKSYSGTYVIPEGIELIATSAFQGCKNLKSIIIPNSVKTIGDHAFSGCEEISSINIPNSVTNIGKDAFSKCSNLTSITIPESVTSIGDRAFWRCRNLKSVSFPNSVVDVGRRVFLECKELIQPVYNAHIFVYMPHRYEESAYIIPNGIQKIAGGAFEECSCLTSIMIPNSVKIIGNFAFYECRSLESITIPNKVIRTGRYTFFGCKKLKSITIPNSVTYIEREAFEGCESLTSVIIPNGVTHIGYQAFKGCTNLDYITIPASLEYVGTDAFDGCLDMQVIYSN